MSGVVFLLDRLVQKLKGHAVAYSLKGGKRHVVHPLPCMPSQENLPFSLLPDVPPKSCTGGKDMLSQLSQHPTYRGA